MRHTAMMKIFRQASSFFFLLLIVMTTTTTRDTGFHPCIHRRCIPNTHEIHFFFHFIWAAYCHSNRLIHISFESEQKKNEWMTANDNTNINMISRQSAATAWIFFTDGMLLIKRQLKGIEIKIENLPTSFVVALYVNIIFVSSVLRLSIMFCFLIIFNNLRRQCARTDFIRFIIIFKLCNPVWIKYYILSLSAVRHLTHDSYL